MKGMILTIDTGANIGWAAWEVSAWARLEPPYGNGVIYERPRMTWEESLLDVLKTFRRDVLVPLTPSTCYLEKPKYHEARGQATARSGALVKLAIAAGAEMAICTEFSAIRWVEIADWKGQMPKDAVERRIRKRLGDEACQNFRSHAWDAVGIGLHAKGFF